MLSEFETRMNRKEWNMKGGNDELYAIVCGLQLKILTVIRECRCLRDQERSLKALSECQQQVKATKRYIRTGNLDALASLPEELRPELNSLDS